MKKLLFTFLISAALSSFADDGNINALKKERLSLISLPVYEYRKVDHPKINIERYAKRTLVNRRFVFRPAPKSIKILGWQKAYNKAFDEWQSCCRKVEEYEKVRARLKEIDSILKK